MIHICKQFVFSMIFKLWWMGGWVEKNIGFSTWKLKVIAKGSEKIVGPS